MLAILVLLSYELSTNLQSVRGLERQLSEYNGSLNSVTSLILSQLYDDYGGTSHVRGNTTGFLVWRKETLKKKKLQKTFERR